MGLFEVNVVYTTELLCCRNNNFRSIYFMLVFLKFRNGIKMTWKKITQQQLSDNKKPKWPHKKLLNILIKHGWNILRFMTVLKILRRMTESFICDLGNSSPHPGQNGLHLADDLFKYTYMKQKSCVFIRISLKFIPKGPIDNDSALVLVKACRRAGGKPLPEPMLTQFTDVYMRH